MQWQPSLAILSFITQFHFTTSGLSIYRAGDTLSGIGTFYIEIDLPVKSPGCYLGDVHSPFLMTDPRYTASVRRPALRFT